MKKMIMAAALAMGLGLGSTGASAATLTFQDVTFTTEDLGGGLLQLTITNALNASGDWTGASFLQSFALGEIGAFTSATLAGWDASDGGLNAGGCNGAGEGFVCFDKGGGSTLTALTNNMVFDIQFNPVGGLDFVAPHLKLAFWDTETSGKIGSLLSQDIPGPIVGAGLPGLLLACGGLVALARRRRQQVA